MDQEQRERQLEALRKVLRAGRDRRRSDLANTGEEIQGALSAYKGKAALEHEREISPMLDAASARRMLSHIDLEDRYGKETSVEVAEAKLREKYEKRPSVRALKKSKDKGLGGPSI